MLNKCVQMFNEFHGVNANTHTVDGGYITLSMGNEIKGFVGESELINFLMCGSSHLPFVKPEKHYYTAYNIAMMYLNRKCGCTGLVYSVSSNGMTTLWGLDHVGWYKVSEYSCLNSLYRAIMTDVNAIKGKVRVQGGFISRIKRLFS